MGDARVAIVAALQMPDVDMEKGIVIVIATAKADISVELIIVDLKGLVDPLMRMTTAVQSAIMEEIIAALEVINVVKVKEIVIMTAIVRLAYIVDPTIVIEDRALIPQMIVALVRYPCFNSLTFMCHLLHTKYIPFC